MADLLALIVLLSVFDAPIECERCEQWNRPQDPFHVYGNTWYVGTGGLGSVLIVSDDGLILLDGGLPQSAEMIAANIRSAGFDPQDIRFIGLSHAHYDHAGGIAALQRISGAIVYAGQHAARTLRAGTLLPDDPQFGGGMEGQRFPPVADAAGVDDGWQYRLGEVTITAVATPGHTLGGMSWSWQSCEQQRCLDIVYIDSLTAVSRPGFRFADGLGDVLRESLERVANLDCDILLSTHDSNFELHDKVATGREAFVDPAGCGRLAKKSSTYLARRLESEQP